MVPNESFLDEVKAKFSNPAEVKIAVVSRRQCLGSGSGVAATWVLSLILMWSRLSCDECIMAVH